MTAKGRAVFDCNVYFQALISPAGPSGRCVAIALRREVELFCTSHIIDELRETASHTSVRQKFNSLTDVAVAALIQNIERTAHFLRHVPEAFTYPRDPDDAHYINVALAAKAMYVVSRDKDLLDLMDQSRAEARDFRRRFPSLEIIEPQQFLLELAPNG